jgi:hypothetical protein
VVLAIGKLHFVQLIVIVILQIRLRRIIIFPRPFNQNIYINRHIKWRYLYFELKAMLFLINFINFNPFTPIYWRNYH